MTKPDGLISEGIEEGKIAGKAEGIEERTIQIAQNMLAKNALLDFIVEVTGLSMEELKSLQVKINDKTH